MKHPQVTLAPGVAPIPTTRIGRTLVRLRARWRRRKLDAMLAQGTDPWSSASLLARAEQVASPSHRVRVATALDALVEIAERRRRASPYLELRAAAVLRQRDHLEALAQRLRDPAPVDVAVVVRLALLAWDENSPAFAGGRPVETLGATLELCASALVD